LKKGNKNQEKKSI